MKCNQKVKSSFKNFKAQISLVEQQVSSQGIRQSLDEYPGWKQVLTGDISLSLQVLLTLRKHYSHLLSLPHSLLTFFSDSQFPACFVLNGCHGGAIRPSSLLENFTIDSWFGKTGGGMTGNHDSKAMQQLRACRRKTLLGSDAY